MRKTEWTIPVHLTSHITEYIVWANFTTTQRMKTWIQILHRDVELGDKQLPNSQVVIVLFT